MPLTSTSRRCLIVGFGAAHEDSPSSAFPFSRFHQRKLSGEGLGSTVSFPVRSMSKRNIASSLPSQRTFTIPWLLVGSDMILTVAPAGTKIGVHLSSIESKPRPGSSSLNRFPVNTNSSFAAKKGNCVAPGCLYEEMHNTLSRCSYRPRTRIVVGVFLCLTATICALHGHHRMRSSG